jgi:glycosyltransferase involved in cell wall biosynthesis
MIIIIYSKTYKGKVEQELGESEYSYYFVLKEYRPVLERLGIVVAVGDPENEVDALRRSAIAHGEDCIFLSFAPPHQTLIDLECPTVPIFAWEFDTLPTEVWGGDARNDWRTTLNRLGRAITHSNFAVDTVKAEMGQDFPVVSIPAPVWDRFNDIYRKTSPRPVCAGVEIGVVGTVVDTAAPDFDPALRHLPGPAGQDVPARLRLDGVIYASVFNPRDGRKNWHDMLCAFCLALRGEADATLVFKLTHHDRALAFEHMLETIYRLAPFKCRIVLILGYLTDADYGKLVGATSFVLNASAGEGQCLPLMEFMSAGKPSIAPRNTALTDYLNDENSFPVESSLEPWCWPHDPRQAYRTRRHRIDFASLMQAYRDSYAVARGDPRRYGRMAEAANRDLQAHCSQALVEERLRNFLQLPAACSADGVLSPDSLSPVAS